MSWILKSYVAVESPEHEKWAEAIQKEVDSLHRNKTFTIMSRPRGAPVIGLKWVFKIKENKDGSIERYKARNLQDYHYDYLETFAPVVRYSSVRMLLAVAASRNLTPSYGCRYCIFIRCYAFFGADLC